MPLFNLYMGSEFRTPGTKKPFTETVLQIGPPKVTNHFDNYWYLCAVAPVDKFKELGASTMKPVTENSSTSGYPFENRRKELIENLPL